jgi:hypothetical protein
VSHFRGPPVRTLPPALYRRAVHPLLVLRASPAQRCWLERGQVFFPYFSTRVRFESGATRAALAPLGVRPPALGDYFERLLDFAVDSRWGGTKVGRAQALAAACA